MQYIKMAACAAALLTLFADSGTAQTMRVSPVNVDLPLSSQTAVLSVQNDGSQPINVQARIFRWTQNGTADVLEKTSDAVVSPPAFTLPPGAKNVVRIVRTTPAPVSGEETYRVLLDEIPDRKKLQSGSIAIVMRQSLPVFFAGTDPKPADVRWSAFQTEGKLRLVATNAGQKRLKLLRLHVNGGQEQKIAAMDGLAGYVLGGQSRSWEFPLPRSGVAQSGPLQIEAVSETGPFRASAIVEKKG